MGNGASSGATNRLPVSGKLPPSTECVPSEERLSAMTAMFKIEALPDRHTLVLETPESAHQPSISVRDKAFYSPKPDTGMGLGLSECRKIIKHLGGTIHLGDRNARYTCFQVSLPYVGNPPINSLSTISEPPRGA